MTLITLIIAVILLSNVSFTLNAQQGEKNKLETKPIVQEVFSAEKLMSIRRISQPELSPDDKWIVYSVGEPKMEDNKIYKNLYKISSDGKDYKQLTENGKSNNQAKWSPDGTKIAFISSTSGSTQIWVMDSDGSNKKRITDMPNGVDNLLWSPDGKYFSFTSDVKLEQTIAEKYPFATKANVKIYDKLPIRHWDEWRDELYSHLFIIPINGGEPIDLMQNEKFETPLKPFGGPEEICWSPDSKEIAYTSKKNDGLEFVQNTNSDIYIVSIIDKNTKNISSNLPSFDKAPLYSPDGNWIAFHSQARPGFESDRISIMLFNRKTGKITELTKKIDRWMGEMVWSHDSQFIFSSVEDLGTIQVYKINVNTSKYDIITNGWFNNGYGLSLSKDDKTLFYGRESQTRSLELFVQPLVANSQPIQITHENDIVFLKNKTSKCEEKWITSTDGKKVHCWVLYPPDFDPNKKYPMITFCQGGPQNMIGQKFHFRWNYYLMASHGYVVLMPNRRGVPGFGQEWNDAISKDWGGQPMRDLIAATDELAKEKYIDKNGLCAVGASAGGYACFWLAGHHEKRFKAFVAHCGVFDIVSKYGSTEELWFPNWEFGGPYWEEKNKENYKSNSPHEYVNKWDTPIMISTGEKDFRVPYTQSLEAFTAAQVKKIPSKLLIFPDETHFIAKIQEFCVWSNEFFDFLDKYCKK